jgi:hypothetical protein
MCSISNFSTFIVLEPSPAWITTTLMSSRQALDRPHCYHFVRPSGPSNSSIDRFQRSNRKSLLENTRIARTTSRGSRSGIDALGGRVGIGWSSFGRHSFNGNTQIRLTFVQSKSPGVLVVVHKNGEGQTSPPSVRGCFVCSCSWRLGRTWKKIVIKRRNETKGNKRNREGSISQVPALLHACSRSPARAPALVHSHCGSVAAGRAPSSCVFGRSKVT